MHRFLDINDAIFWSGSLRGSLLHSRVWDGGLREIAGNRGKFGAAPEMVEIRPLPVAPDPESTSYSLTSATSVTEGNQLTFTITRSGDKPAETLYFSTLSGSASFSEGDYATTSGSEPKNIAVSFSSGTTSKTITINILNDGVSDSGEDFRAIVQRNSSDPASTYLARSSSVTINDAAPSTSYSLTSSTSVTEGNQLTFTVTRSGDKPAETVYFSTLSGSASYSEGDYATSSGGEPKNIAVTFTSGATTKTVTINILNDGVSDSGEDFRAIVQRNSSDSTSTYLARSDSVTISDAAQNTNYALTSITAVTEGNQLTFTVTRSGDKPAETAYFSTLSGSASYAAGDYALPGGGEPKNIALSFGSGVTSQTVTINILNDGIADSGETFRAIVQRNSSDSTSTYLVRSDNVTINDAAAQGTSYALTPSGASVTEGGQLTFTITRSGDKPGETLYVSTTQTEGFVNSKDYGGINGQAVVFTSGQSSATITLQTTNDATPEPSETFGFIVQRNSSSSASIYIAKLTFTILDNDSAQQPTYSVVASPNTVDESAGTISFTITRTGSLGSETLYASTLNGSALGYASNSGDYATTINNLAVSFAAGEAVKTVTLAITNDGKAEADETFGLIVQRNASDASTVFLAKTNWTIHDDDAATSSGYSVTPAAARVGEAGSFFFTVTRPAGLPGETVYLSTTQDAGSRNEGDYSNNLNNYAVIFAAGETVKNVSLALINDSKPEQDETFGVIVQHSASDPISTYLARSTWTIDDDDAGAVTTYQVRPNVGVVSSAAGTTVTFYVTRSGDLPQETVYANTITGTEGYSSASGIFNNLFGVPVAFAAGETSSSSPVTVTMLGGTLDAIGDYLLRLLKGAADQIGIAQSTFSVKPAGAPVSPPPSNAGLAIPTLKLPFDVNDPNIKSAYPNLKMPVYQGFGEGFSDHDGPDNISGNSDDNDHGYSSGIDPYLYYAVDFGAVKHTKILSQGVGVVIETRSGISEGTRGDNASDGFGNYVTIQYDRPGGGYYFATYMHLEGSGVIAAGTKVVTGTPIGYSGNTGRDGGYGYHLHVNYGNGLVNTNGLHQYVNKDGVALQIADASSPLSVTGSINTRQDPVLFFDGPYKEGSKATVNNAEASSGPQSTATVHGGSITHASLTANGTDVLVTDTDTDKPFDLLKNFGDLVVTRLQNLFVGFLGGTSILHHTIYFNGTADADQLDAAATDTSITAWGGSGNDTLIAGTGDDALVGGDGNDQLSGGAGADQLLGDAGNDVLDGGTGADLLYGGTGDDTFYVDRQDDLVFENAGEGTDNVVTTAGYYLYANIERLYLAAGAGSIFGVGNELANQIVGNEGDNLIIAGAGDDQVWGGAGKDSLFGQDGVDLLFGEGGVDYLVGGNGNDMLYGGDDADVLYGEAGNDTLVGGDDFKTDILVGGDGDDNLYGDSGFGDYDLMDGGAGNDYYLVDTPADLTFEAAGGGFDTVYADIAGAGYYLYPNVENLVLLGTTPFGVGNELNNNLLGNASANWLLGGAGNDWLNGGGGNDVLFGEGGADVFKFERGTGGDMVGDFVAGTDKIDLSAFGLSWQTVLNSMHENGGATAIDLGNGDFIVLNGVGKAQLSQGDFILGTQSASQVEADWGNAFAVIRPEFGADREFDVPGLMVRLDGGPVWDPGMWA